MQTTAILVAVEEEFRAIRKRMPRAERVSARGISFVRGELGGHLVVLAKSGMGAERARAIANALIEATSPQELLVAGFCAGMRPDVAVGDLVVATELRPAARGNLPTSRPSNALLDETRRLTVNDARIHFGAVVTCDHVMQTATDKRLAGFAPDVVAADMESAGAVDAAKCAGIDWLVIRAITDALEDDLPLDFEEFIGADGDVSRGRIAAHVAMRPWLAPALIRLGGRSTRAAQHLAACLEAFLAMRIAPDIRLRGVQ